MNTPSTPKASEYSGHKDPKHGYDADGHAAERENADFTIGGVVFHRRRKNWEVTRAVRAMLRAQERASERQTKAIRALDEIDGTTIARLEAQLEASDAEGRLRIDPDSDRAKRLQAKLDRLQEADERLDDDDRARQLEEGRAELDEATDESDDTAYGLIALLLRDPDGNPPTADFLKSELDVEDAGELAAKLSGGGEPDPTETGTATPTS